MTMRVFSYGGGVQSTAALVLAARGEIDFRTFLFCNVGNDSENPKTIEYIEKYAKPYANANGIKLIELVRIPVKGPNKGKVQTVYEKCIADNRSINIPIWMQGGGMGNRTCTAEFKIKVVAKWLRDHSATKDNVAVVGLGISMDEVHRMNVSRINILENHFPLIELGINRMDCVKIIEIAHIPVPPRSACCFCPFKRVREWKEMRVNDPEMFRKAIEFEDAINKKRERLGRDHVFLHESAIKLEDAVGIQHSLFDEDGCDSGYCFT